MAAKVDTELLIEVGPESEEEQSLNEETDSSDNARERPEGDGNSDSDENGGVEPDPEPPLGVYEAVGIDNNKEKQGNCWQRSGRAVKTCLIGCCHDCKTIDKVLFVFHILLILVGFGVGTVTTLSKMSTHNQCYLKAHYHPDGSMDYSTELYWCDSLLYDALVTMSLGFLFIMVNWTAQLNKNSWWIWIKLGLHVSGWLLQVASGIMLVIAFFSWCTSMESAKSADEDLQISHNKTNKCLAAARYFDEDKNEESTLTNLYSFTLISLGIALLAVVLWTITLVLEIAHFCEHLYRKQDEHTEEEDDYHLDDDDDEEDDEEGERYKYPPYEENIVRRRGVGVYNLEVNGEEGAVGGAVGGDNLGDVAA